MHTFARKQKQERCKHLHFVWTCGAFPTIAFSHVCAMLPTPSQLAGNGACSSCVAAAPIL